MKLPEEMVDFIATRTEDMRRVEKFEDQKKIDDLHYNDRCDTYNKELRERSGGVNSDDKMVVFLYDLIRAHLPAGTVESLVREAQYSEVNFTNGYLANYCKDLAERLK